MYQLQEKTREAIDTGKLNYLVRDDTITLSNYLSRVGHAAQVSLTSVEQFASGGDEPLPSMFSSNPQRPAGNPRCGKADISQLNAKDDTASTVHPSNVIAGLSPYIATAFFLAFVACLAVADSAAVAPLPVSLLDMARSPKTEQGAVAAFISIPSDGGLETRSPSQTPSLADPAWSETVATFKRLVAQQKSSQALQVKQAENERLLGQFEAWLNAKAH